MIDHTDLAVADDRYAGWRARLGPDVDAGDPLGAIAGPRPWAVRHRSRCRRPAGDVAVDAASRPPGTCTAPP